jgi:ABC-2 type transport system permease protein
VIGRLTTLLWRELESLFFAPLAYIVLTVFLILNGFSFAIALQQSGGVVEDTVRIFLGEGLLFWLCLIMLPPLVTMRLVAEERRSGTLEVLLTAPVRDGEVILAKFAGAMVFQAFLWAPTLLYLYIIKGYGAVPEPGQVITSYVGIVAATSLLTAVGLLFSTRTTNQIVAAVGGLTFNLVFVLLPVFVAGSSTSEVVRQSVATISMFGHFGTTFGRGLIDSGVMTWYVAATLAVLVLATRSLEARRWR